MPFLEKRTWDIAPDEAASRGLGLDESTPAWMRDEYKPSAAVRSSAPRRSSLGAAQQLCASLECAGGWKMPWRNRRRPIFEGNWGCSSRCLESMIRRALRRERGDLRPRLDEEAPHRHRVPLGLVMLSLGWITQAQLRQALDAQRCAGQGRIGHWLVQECGIPSAEITRALAMQWSCPVLPMDGFSPSAMALTMPRRFAEEFGILPLQVAGSRILYLAFSDRLDAAAAFAIEQMSGLKVESGLIDESQFSFAQGRLLESQFVPVEEDSVSNTDTLATKIAAILEQAQPMNARVVRLRQRYWLRMWLETGAYSGVGYLPATGEDVTDTIFTLTANA